MTIPEKKELQGVIVPVVTPLDKHEELNRPALEKLLGSLISAGVDGVFIGGSVGMGPMLDDEVWRELMTSALAIVGSKSSLMAGVIETSTRRAVKKIEFLAEIGYETIVVTPTFYIKLERMLEFMRHFGACRESASGMRMLAYNIPPCTGSEIPLRCIREMARKNWLVGLKESSGDKEYFQEAFEIAGECGFKLFQGNEVDIAWALGLGADGIVPVCANFDPGLYVETWRSRNDHSRMTALQKKIDLNKAKFVVGDGNRNWISEVINETATRLHLDCAAAEPLDAREEGYTSG